MSDLAAVLTALSGVITAFGLGAWKIWTVVAAVNSQLQEIADEAEARRKIAEAEAVALRGEVAQLRAETAALRNEVHDLRKEAQERDEELSELIDLRSENEELQQSISDLESRLIEANGRADQYEKLWRAHQAAKTESEKP